MARHRDVRNMDADEYDDEDEDDDLYGSSYGSSALSSSAGGALSSSVENYVYKRGAGHTPKMSAFMVGPSLEEVDDEDEEDEESRRRRSRMRDRSDSETSSSSSSNNNPDDNLDKRLSPTDQAKMAACLEEILDVMGDTMPEVVIKEAIVRCDFDTQLALNTLLNHPTKHSGGQGSGSGRSRGRRNDDIPRKTATDTTSTLVSSPSSSALPIQIGSPQQINRGVDTKRSSTVNVLPTLRTVSTTSQLLDREGEIAERNELSLNPSQSTSALNRLSDATTTSSSSSTTTMRKQALDVSSLYASLSSSSSSSALLNLVVVGHVDSGKSTLMGRLLLELGQVSSKALHKFETESRKMGKQSFMYAWVLDETAEERQRGITMDIGHNYFETKTKRIHLLDAPGHKDFIPNMISGAHQADVAILVVNAARGEFEAGFEAGGQTREHALLVRSLGVTQLIVAVNKLDLVHHYAQHGTQDRFNHIVDKLKSFLTRQAGFKESDITFVPCSGFTGENLVSKKEGSDLLNWYKSRTLIEAIDNLRSPDRPIVKPFRMAVVDVFKSAQASAITVAGRIEAGYVQKDDRVLVMPAAQVATVKSVLGEQESAYNSDLINGGAFAGEQVNLSLVGIDTTILTSGTVLCDPAKPIGIAKRVRARVVVFQTLETPITKGWPVVLHYGSVQIQAIVAKLLGVVSKSSGEIIKKKPRFLQKNCNAIVELEFESPLCMEVYADNRELGRFMLRSNGKTIAAGLVTKLVN